MPALPLGLLSSTLLPGHPDFADLPWDTEFDDWTDRSDRLVQLPQGPSRHAVVFVNYDGRLYALKQLPPAVAAKEYELLRAMAVLQLPVVQPIGHLSVRTAADEASVLITRYLDRSLPYHMLFQRTALARYREHLLDAMINLLVQLHLTGVYWGDGSLYNTLFRRDADTLQAYLVDAETSEIRPRLNERLRENDVDILVENVCGALVDLDAVGSLPDTFDIYATDDYLRKRYDDLWNEITRTDVLEPAESYRIQQRIRALNALGFSVGELEIGAGEPNQPLRLRAIVTDRHFHRNLLQTLTGIDAEEMQARLMVNEIRELNVRLALRQNRSIPLSVAAFHWINEVYRRAYERLRVLEAPDLSAIDLYCELLEHKWYLSERAGHDVGHRAAIDDYLAQRRQTASAG